MSHSYQNIMQLYEENISKKKTLTWKSLRSIGFYFELVNVTNIPGMRLCLILETY